MAAVDPSDRKFYVMAADRGNPGALRKFDTALKAQSAAPREVDHRPTASASEKLRVTSPGTKSVQTKLNALGHNAGSEDGISGPKTTAAIKAFQKANGLVADGIAGPKTLAALNTVSNKPAPYVASTPPKIEPAAPPKVDGSDRKFYNMAVDRDVEGAEVALRKFDRALSGEAPAERTSGEDYIDDLREADGLGEAYQLHLEMLGYNPGKVDGVLGKVTGEAVREFQRDNGLAPDGILGRRRRAP